MSEDLELRVAWERHVGRSPVAHDWFERVVRLHRMPDRHYHGSRHVVWVVRQVEALAATFEDADTAHAVDLDATIAAAFFHDVIYDPTSHDNEARSAAMAIAALGEIGWSPARCKVVGELVVATRTHDPTTSDAATAVLIAADLSILAADASAYADYARNVRKEYSHIGEVEWTTGRDRVLRSFLDRTSVFPELLGLADWDRRARANITAERAQLSLGGSHDDEDAHEP